MEKIHQRMKVSLSEKLDLDELDWTLFIMDLEESLDIDLDEMDLTIYECDTVKDLVTYLTNNA